jgi:predicted negative regulator of RcsB-dependent stress response
MALHLDLEEQEQVDQLKHFWKQYGNIILWVLIGVFGSIAAVNVWNIWQNRQAAGASVLFDEVVKAVDSKDAAKVQRAVDDMKDKYGKTLAGQQAVMLGAQSLSELGKTEQSMSALAWVADQAADEAYREMARLRLAALLLDKKSFDEAIKRVDEVQLPAFTGLAADRKGDIFMAKAQPALAKAEYEKAYKLIPASDEYRMLVLAKLNSLGGDAPAEGKQ